MVGHGDKYQPNIQITNKYGEIEPKQEWNSNFLLWEKEESAAPLWKAFQSLPQKKKFSSASLEAVGFALSLKEKHIQF